jgi:diguanylate cyclase (GGDEF)-like protein/PAS domain S-box-containing protein
MTGYDCSEMTGRSMPDFLSEESRTYIRERWNQNLPIRVEGFVNPVLYDVEMICKNGEIIWCEVCVKPLFKDNIFVGYIGTTRDISEKKMFEKKTQRYLEELEQKNKQLEDLASLDMLTGVYNRRKFEYFVGLEIEKMVKYNSPFSIIIFDIDNFKSINDHYGHETGDRILQDITTITRNTLRTTDKLFRWGGDEFIILLHDFTLQKACQVADNVRTAIQAYNFDIKNKDVTVSLGVGDYALNESLDQLITRADNALLKAKYKGKNKAECC